jgi:hypothetical protein
MSDMSIMKLQIVGAYCLTMGTPWDEMMPLTRDKA